MRNLRPIRFLITKIICLIPLEILLQNIMCCCSFLIILFHDSYLLEVTLILSRVICFAISIGYTRTRYHLTFWICNIINNHEKSNHTHAHHYYHTHTDLRKNVNVTPIPKKCVSQSDPTNYRPKSVTSVLTKIIEKLSCSTSRYYNWNCMVGI